LQITVFKIKRGIQEWNESPKAGLTFANFSIVSKT
jgi:hypothetical protein